MSYLKMNREQLQTELKKRFSRKSLEREARGVKLNKSNDYLRQLLSEADAKPILTNQRFTAVKKFFEDIKIKKAKQELEAKTVDELSGKDVVLAFRRLQKMKHKFTKEDVNAITKNGTKKIMLKIKFDNDKEQMLTLHSDKYKKLINRLITKNRWYDFDEDIQGSDVWEQYRDVPINSVSLQEIVKTAKPTIKDIDTYGSKIVKNIGTSVRKYNGFFKYINTTDIPLEKYQIYTVDSQDETEVENCLIYTLSKLVEPEKIKEIKLAVRHLGLMIPLNKMNEIANIIKRKIVMYYYDESLSNQKVKHDRVYGKEFKEVIKIAQYKNHIFEYEEKTPYTKYYIQHYHEIEEVAKTTSLVDKFSINMKTGKKYISKNVVYLDSLNLVLNMHRSGLFSDYAVTIKPCSNYVSDPTLINIADNQRPFVMKEKKEADVIYMVADCEADVVSGDHQMLAFEYCCNGKYTQIVHNGDDEEFAETISNCLAETCFENGLEKIDQYQQNKKVQIYFHNVKYDSGLFRNMFYSNYEISQGSTLYSKTYKIKHSISITFVDSFKHFGGKLSEASETFKLDANKQEAINYKFYTKNNIGSNKLVLVDDYKKGIRPELHSTLIQNLQENTELFKYDGEFFNPNEYYLYYLHCDVKVLYKAMEKYVELMKELTGLDARKSLTISSLSHASAVKYGCYDGVYETKGNLRAYIQKAVRGGRVYVNPDYKNKEISEKIEDFDGVSLYPSSMNRLCKEYGLPKGEIKSSTEKSISFYNEKTYYFVRIIINNIRKTQQIPCISITNKDGLLQYINKVDQPTEFTVDKITLEDWIKFHDIEYEIIDGIYWDEGFNTKLGEYMVDLHNERCKYKKSNKPKATMIKLLMNSTYGKTIQRSTDTNTKFVAKDKFNNYVCDHFGVIDSCEEEKFNYKVVERAFDNSYGLTYAGAMILSMSKRIMNEVFGTMNDHNMPVFYTDTDSIHMLQKDVEPLSKLFKEQYGREVNGKDLGQFHVDFDMNKCINVHSTKFIAICPKTYLDVLEGTDEKTGEIKQDIHYRIKGITKSGAVHEIERRMSLYKQNEIEAAVGLFRDLSENICVRFKMIPTEYDCAFEFGSYGVRNRPNNWTRTLNKIKSLGDESDEDLDD